MTRHFQRFYVAIILLLMMSFASAYSLANDRLVRIGVYDNPPKILLNSEGEMSGFFGDLIKEIALREHWTLEAVPCDWNECLTLLQEGKLDLMPDVARTAAREDILSFHQQIALHSWSQVFSHRSANIKSVLDLNHSRLAVLEGSVQQAYLSQVAQEFDLQIEWIVINQFQDGLALVKAGQADAIATNNLYGAFYAEAFDLEATSIIFQPAQLFFAAPLGQSEYILARVDHWLAQWLHQPNSPYLQILQGWQSPKTVTVIPTSAWVLAATLIILLSLALVIVKRLRSEVHIKRIELRKNDDKLSTILNNLHAYVYIKNLEQQYVYASPKVCELFQCEETDILGKTDQDFFDTDTADAIQTLDQHVISSGETSIREEANKLPEEHESRVFLSIKVPMRDEQGTIYALCGMATDITEQTRHKQEVHQLSYYDLLTGLPNRRLFFDRLQQSLAKQHVKSGNGALILLDIDNFRSLNDTLGHQVGDQLLQQIAKRLNLYLHINDTLARFGGDEFMLILENLATESHEVLNQVEQVIDVLKRALAQPFQLNDQEITASISFGVALFSESHQDANELIQHAELAVFDAKKSGQQQVRFFDQHMQQKAEQRSQVERGLRQALKQHAFILYYQPQYRDTDLIGAEALIRWQSEQHGLVSPADFIPVAETTGLIIPIGEWVLRVACEQLVEWSRQPQTSHLNLAVNISAVQMRHQDFVQHVISVLQDTGAPAEHLEFELTESMLIDNIDDTIAKIHQLKALGIRFSLDDFGTGYSSLSMLTRFPMDTLKVDQSFVYDMHRNLRDFNIVKTIIELSRSLDLNVIAEGVETPEQKEALEQLGCHQFQGYLFAKPMPIDEYMRLIPV